MWAFTDESERSGVMLLALVILDPGEVEGARREFRGLLLPGQRRVHTAKESPRRRRTILDTVARVDGLSTTVLRYRRPSGVGRVSGRGLLLQAACGLAVGPASRPGCSMTKTKHSGYGIVPLSPMYLPG